MIYITCKSFYIAGIMLLAGIIIYLTIFGGSLRPKSTAYIDRKPILEHKINLTEK